MGSHRARRRLSGQARVEQDDGGNHRGRMLSDREAKARFYHAVCEADLLRIIGVDLKVELVSYEIAETAHGRTELMGGKLLLGTNAEEFAPDDEVAPYKHTPRHRVQLQGAEIRDRDRAGLSSGSRLACRHHADAVPMNLSTTAGRRTLQANVDCDRAGRAAQAVRGSTVRTRTIKACNSVM